VASRVLTRNRSAATISGDRFGAPSDFDVAAVFGDMLGADIPSSNFMVDIAP
jgi:hypothetical protein